VTGISHCSSTYVQGTPKYGKGEIARLLQRNGASFNAATFARLYELLGRSSRRTASSWRWRSEAVHDERGDPEEEHGSKYGGPFSGSSETRTIRTGPLHGTLRQGLSARPITGRHRVAKRRSRRSKRSRSRPLRRYYVPKQRPVVIVGTWRRPRPSRSCGNTSAPSRGARSRRRSDGGASAVGERRFQDAEARGPVPGRLQGPAAHDADTNALDGWAWSWLWEGLAPVSGLVEGTSPRKPKWRRNGARSPPGFIAEATGLPAWRSTGGAGAARGAEGMKAEPPSQAELSRAKKQLQASFIYPGLRSEPGPNNGVLPTVGHTDTWTPTSNRDREGSFRGYPAGGAISRRGRPTIGDYDPLDAVPRGETAVRPGPTEGPRRAAGREPYGARYLAARRRGPHHAGHRAARFELPNGLVVISGRIIANPTVAIQGLVKAGAIYDPPGKRRARRPCGGDGSTGAPRIARPWSKPKRWRASPRASASMAGPETATFSGTALAGGHGTVLGAWPTRSRNPAFAE